MQNLHSSSQKQALHKGSACISEVVCTMGNVRNKHVQGIRIRGREAFGEVGESENLS